MAYKWTGTNTRAIVSASHKKELIFLIRVFHFDGDKNAHAFRIKAMPAKAK